MRKILIPLLLAGVAAAGPAFADPSDQSQADQHQSRHNRDLGREQNAQRQDTMRRQASFERQASVQRVDVQRPDSQRMADVQRMNVERMAQAEQRVRTQGQLNRGQRFQYQQQRVDPVQQQRVTFRQDRYDPRVDTQTARETNRQWSQSGRSRDMTRVPRQGMEPPQPTRVRTTRSPQWSTNWRNDRRYDWRDYRHRNRARFHIGFYYDPFGWGYSPFSIGSRLWPNYYSSRYWINDPWQYRLPYAPPGTQWVRYWNDAILVDMWNGQVVDVIHNFFW